MSLMVEERGFSLDPRIASSSEFVADLPLCQARLQNDARFPWIVLSPRRSALREIDDLTLEERRLLIEEQVLAGHAVRALGEAIGRPVEKLNHGALGNVVAQLHVHVLGRRSDDPAWPGPVWGFGAPEPYTPGQLAERVDVGRKALVNPV